MKLIYTFWDLIVILIKVKSLSYLFLSGKGNSDRTLKILGNGNSLNSQNYLRSGKDDFMVVNRHVLMDNYTVIKPNYYVLADFHFYIRDEGLGILRMINEKTSWPMYLCLNMSRRRRKTVFPMITNPLIKVLIYNDCPYRGYKRIAHLLYDMRLSMPVPQNVIVPSIMLGVQFNYGNIELFGVEHNWLKNLYVDSHNVVYLTNSHCYDSNPISAKPVKEIQNDKEYPLYRLLNQYARMFQSYWEIKEYVSMKKKKTWVKNKCSDSFIDAFEKC